MQCSQAAGYSLDACRKKLLGALPELYLQRLLSLTVLMVLSGLLVPTVNGQAPVPQPATAKQCFQDRHTPCLILSIATTSAPNLPPCSAAALLAAIEAGADMVYFELEESIDGVPFVFCMKSLSQATGRAGKIRRMASNKVRELFYKNSDETIMSFDMAVELAREKVGLFLQVRPPGPSQDFLHAIRNGLRRTGLAGVSLIAGDMHPTDVLLYPEARVLLPLDEKQKAPADQLDRYFALISPEGLPESQWQELRELREQGLFVVLDLRKADPDSSSFQDLLQKHVDAFLLSWSSFQKARQAVQSVGKGR